MAEAAAPFPARQEKQTPKKTEAAQNEDINLFGLLQDAWRNFTGGKQKPIDIAQQREDAAMLHAARLKLQQRQKK